MFTKERFKKVQMTSKKVFLYVKKLVNSPFFKKWIAPALLRFVIKLILKAL